MVRKFSMVMCMLVIVFTASAGHAGLSSNWYLDVWPYWQVDSPWAEATYDHSSLKIKDMGCALTSLVMVLNWWNLNYSPIPWPRCDIDISAPTNPFYLNSWMNFKNGYNSKGAVQWLSMKNYYYCGVYPGYLYQYMRPYWSCDMTSPKNNCFMVDGSSQAGTLLDYDLLAGRPVIAKVNKSGRIHFVVINGYCFDKSDYIVLDPGQTIFSSSQKENFCRTDNGGLVPTLKGINATLLRIYRYQGVTTNIAPKIGYLYFYDLSPIQYQILNPQGQITGYDPVTGNTIADAPGTNYFEESIDSLDPNDPPSEPSHVLMMDEPSSGNYIIKVFGMGDGPYTVKMTGMTDDGTALDDAPIITGTAYPGMAETYRISYSASTGQRTISTNNQAPVANAGTNQETKIGQTVTLDDSESYDPDGDPLRVTWSFVSKPVGSTVELSDPHLKQPVFTPDVPGDYVLQLTVSDLFIETAPSSLTITVYANQPPVARAGSGQTIFSSDGAGPITVTLDGSGSYDPEGQPVTFKWSLIERPAGSYSALSTTDVATPSLLIDTMGTYVAQLIVNDGQVDSSASTVTITALRPIDIAIKAFRVPRRVVLGDTKELTVVVKNLSSTDASFEVAIYYTAEDVFSGTLEKAIGVETAGKGGTSVKIPFTPTMSGTYYLHVKVRVTNPISGDPNTTDNEMHDSIIVVGQ